MSPEEATLVADMRGRILANVQRNLPPETGITAEELQKVLALTRADQRAAQLKSKASGVSAPSGPPPSVDALKALFAKPAPPAAT